MLEHCAAIRVGLLAALLAACGASQASLYDGGQSGSSLYDCTVVQIRTGSCEEPLPNCAVDGGRLPSSFEMEVSGNVVSWVGCPVLSCTGTWTDGGTFSYLLPPGATQALGQQCPAEPWTLLPQDPNPARALQPAEVLYAGIPLSNSFNAHCRPH